MTINDLLVDKTIKNIQVVRGLGIIPTRIEIEVCDEKEYFIIEVESNFRILDRTNCLVCFDDLYLDSKCNEMTPQKFRKQKGVENTLIFFNINRNYKRIVDKKIKKIKISPFGDVDLYLSNRVKIQIINDTHLNDSCILRIKWKNSFEEYIANNGKIFKIQKVIFEMKNENGKISFSM